MDYTPEQMDQLFNSLPDDVKEAMTSVDTVDILMDLKKKYSLHIDQGGALSREIALLMVGITSPTEFISKIQSSMSISHDVAIKIGTEVNERIFRPVRESLKTIHHMNAEPKKEAPKPEVPIPVTPMAPSQKSEAPVPKAQTEAPSQTPAVPPLSKPADPYREPIN